MDIDVSLVEDCKRLAKQCKMADLIDELEIKCKQVYEFGKAHLMIMLKELKPFSNYLRNVNLLNATPINF